LCVAPSAESLSGVPAFPVRFVKAIRIDGGDVFKEGRLRFAIREICRRELPAMEPGTASVLVK